MAYPCILRWTLTLAILLLATAKATDAINCYVCQSVNGSNVDCERGKSNGELADTLLENNCRSVIGSVDGRTPMKATACIVLMGEFRDKQTKEVKYVISRKCTAAVQAWTQAKSVNCNLFDSEGHLPGENQFITGCAEACFADKCNGKTAAGLAERFRPGMKEYIEYAQRNDPRTKIRFPAIFGGVPEETQRGLVTTMTPEKSDLTSEATQTATFLGPLILALLLAL